MNRSRLSLLVCLFLLPAAQAMGQGTPEPSLSFEENAIVASGLTPGEKAVWFGVERRTDEEFSTELARHQGLEPVAPDGTARLVLARPAASSSVWVVVDLETGAYKVTAPEGYLIARAISLLPSLNQGAVDLPDGIVDQRPYVFGLLVRPGEGAWSFAGGDGGDQDSDGIVNGQSRFALDQLAALPGAEESLAPPVKANSGDLWIVVDPRKMEISVHKGGLLQ
jgi:hypothetical protein